MQTNQWQAFVSWLQQRLQQPLPGYEAQRRMMSVYRPDSSLAPAHARQSGVLLLLYPANDLIHLVLIERSADGGVHSGQIALPGGRKEETDTDIVATALRESNEEVALDPASVQVLGRLSSLYIPVSNFAVHPVVGVCEEQPMLSGSDAEVAQILELSLGEIFFVKEKITVPLSGFPEMKIKAMAYLLQGGRFIWGATAMILSELECLMEEWQLQQRNLTDQN